MLTRAFLTLFRLDVSTSQTSKRLRRRRWPRSRIALAAMIHAPCWGRLGRHDRDEVLYRLDAMGAR